MTTETQAQHGDWTSGWNDVKTVAPPLRDSVSRQGWSEKHYVLAVDAKGRMSIGFATKRYWVSPVTVALTREVPRE